MRCPNCGKVNADDARYCEECSTPMPTKFSALKSIQNRSETCTANVQNDIESTPSTVLKQKWWLWLVIAVVAFGIASVIFPHDSAGDSTKISTAIVTEPIMYDFSTAELPTGSSMAGGVPCTPIFQGQQIELPGVAQFNFSLIYWGETLEPINVNDYSLTLEDEEDNIYFIVEGELKNLSSKTIDLNNISMKLVCNSEQEYGYENCFVANETKDGADIYSFADSIAPYETEKIFLVCSVPNEMYYMCTNAEMFFGFDESFSSDVFAADGFEMCDYVYSILLAG